MTRWSAVYTFILFVWSLVLVLDSVLTKLYWYTDMFVGTFYLKLLKKIITHNKVLLTLVYYSEHFFWLCWTLADYEHTFQSMKLEITFLVYIIASSSGYAKSPLKYLRLILWTECKTSFDEMRNEICRYTGELYCWFSVLSWLEMWNLEYYRNL